MTLAPSSPSSYLTAQDAISAIVAAEGNLDLAAERLFGFEEGTNSRAQLIALLAEDPTAHANLQRTLRTLSLMEAFATFKEVALSVRGTLDTKHQLTINPPQPLPHRGSVQVPTTRCPTGAQSHRSRYHYRLTR
jgi:hypothetical protein